MSLEGEGGRGGREGGGREEGKGREGGWGGRKEGREGGRGGMTVIHTLI